MNAIKRESKFFVIIALLLNVISCTHQNGDSSVFSNNVYSIKSEVFLNDTLLMDPWNILFHDSLIVIANFKAVPLIEIYDTEGRELSKFLTIGQGPEEVLTVGGLQSSPVNKNLFVYDLFRKSFLEYNLKNFSQPNFKPERVYNYSSFIYNYQKDSTALFDKLLYGKNYLIGESRDPRGRIVLLDYYGKLINFVGKYPQNTNDGLSNYGYVQLYASAFILSDDSYKVALATYSADMLDIFDISDTNNPKTLYSYQNFLPHDLFTFSDKNFSKAAFTKESQQGYCDITASHEYVFALYSGRKLKDKNYSYGSKIRVISWDGIKRFELQSDKDLKRIAVTPNNEALYAIAKDDENNPIIVIFDIKEIINIINKQ